MTKPKCLSIFNQNFMSRKYRNTLAGKFLNGKFLSFGVLAQAGQVVADVTGGRYGIVLGGWQGAMTDAYWGAWKSGKEGLPSVTLSQEGNILQRAVVQAQGVPDYQGVSSMLSFDDHMLLLAAEVIALRVLREQPASAPWESRVGELLDSPVISLPVVKPATRQALTEFGIDPDAPQGFMTPGLEVGATYREAYNAIIARQDQALFDLAAEYPNESYGQYYSMLMRDGSIEVLESLAGGAPVLEPVFSPEEYTIARMFEVGVLPPGEPEVDEVKLFIERALSLARAVGRELPSAYELRAAAVEVWGTYVSR